MAATNIPRVILELMLCGNHLVSSFGVGHQQVTKICGVPMDEASVRATSTARLLLTVYHCLREVCQRCNITINEQSTVTIRFGGPPPEPQPTNPPAHFLCCLRCARCSDYCSSRDPSHTAQLCRRHQDSTSHMPP